MSMAICSEPSSDRPPPIVLTPDTVRSRPPTYGPATLGLSGSFIRLGCWRSGALARSRPKPHRPWMVSASRLSVGATLWRGKTFEDRRGSVADTRCRHESGGRKLGCWPRRLASRCRHTMPALSRRQEASMLTPARRSYSRQTASARCGGRSCDRPPPFLVTRDSAPSLPATCGPAPPRPSSDRSRSGGRCARSPTPRTPPNDLRRRPTCRSGGPT